MIMLARTRAMRTSSARTRLPASSRRVATGTASVLLNVKPRVDSRHHVIAEALTLGNNLPSDTFTDSHGNGYHRVQLAMGSNYFRHDAIVAVPSMPDDQDPQGAAALAPGELSVSEAYRYWG